MISFYKFTSQERGCVFEMKKIISGILGILMVTAVVGGTAYALFTDKATVNGISITAGTAKLLVNGKDNINAAIGETVFPGYFEEADFTLENVSTVGVDMNVSARLISANGWATSPDLRDSVQVRIGTGGNFGAWYTLQEWNDSARSLIGGELVAQDGPRTYTVQMRVLSSVGNEIFGEALTNITYELTGTQVL